MKVELAAVFLMLLLAAVVTPMMSTEDSVQAWSFVKSKMMKNGQERCASPLDAANKTKPSSSLQDCSIDCAFDENCNYFNLKNSLTCDRINT